MKGVLKTMNSFVLALLLGVALIAVISGAKADQSGFISIDCGLSENSDYTDSVTGIKYTSDSGSIDSGESQTISEIYKTNSSKQYWNVRSFPQGRRNCYTLSVDHENNRTYLIRASFMYGDYNGGSKRPRFDIHVGVEYSYTIEIDDVTYIYYWEIILIPTSRHINICLVKTDRGIPFISTLELRPLNNNMYPMKFGYLLLYARINFCPVVFDSLIRYDDDVYDRIWRPMTLANTTTLSTIYTVKSDAELPSAVMRTACTVRNSSEPLSFFWGSELTYSDKYYVYMYFAEFEIFKDNETREFNIYMNNFPWFGAISPSYLSTFTAYTGMPESYSEKYEVEIRKTKISNFPPIINAIEVYQLKEFTLSETYFGDATAVLSIKSTYKLTKNWEADPCAPADFVWDGVTCNKDGSDPPRIISLDLSNNHLTGLVPHFLADMPSLEVLKLEGNNFTLPLPPQLLEKVKQGKLIFSTDNLNNNTNASRANNQSSSTDACANSQCKRKNKVIIPVAASIVISFVLLTLFVTVLWTTRKKKRDLKKANKIDIAPHEIDDELEAKSRGFTYSEIIDITMNFTRIIGKGGFSTVYHGYFGDSEVAVKMLSSCRGQGSKELQDEAKVLVNIHHRNLTSLIGYCIEGSNMGIVFEYMSNGDLGKHLSGADLLHVLSWQERLQIAIDAAQGLEYLHHGCKPSIIHRDIKCVNILLNDKFQAKLADFGLSRSFPKEGGSHISTLHVAGTPGYLDPEYYTTFRLTVKSDIYSFGVVLLELITSRQAVIATEPYHINIVQWVTSVLEQGDVKAIVDPRLMGEYDVYSVENVIDIAMACVIREASKRPTMNHVVIELRKCLAMEMARQVKQ